MNGYEADNEDDIYMNTEHANYAHYHTDDKPSSDTNRICIEHDTDISIHQFQKQLELQPERLRLAFKSEYNQNTNTSIIKLDCRSMFTQLLTSNDTFLYKNRSQKYYRNYIAAIARIFEDELIKFVSQPINEITREPLQTGSKYTCISAEGIFQSNPKLRQLLCDIAQKRFQCPYVHYKNRQFIAIWYGKWIQNNSNPNQLCMVEPPNQWLLDEYKLSSICRNRQINAIVRLIEKQYKRISSHNPTLLNTINEYSQLYSWSIMNHAINQVIPKQVWTWLNSNDIHYNDNTINSELYDTFSRTFEIVVSPAKPLILERKQTETEQAISKQRICNILQEIYKHIRDDEIACSGLECYLSPNLYAPLQNYKIVRISNDSSIACVRTKIIAKIQRKYKHKYDVKFRKLCNASTSSYRVCGYVPMWEHEKTYMLDMEKGVISQLIKDTLISKEQCKIKSLELFGCQSYKLAQIFAPFVECIICEHTQNKIDDSDHNTCVKGRHFYRKLAKFIVDSYIRQIDIFIPLSIIDMCYDYYR